MNATFIKEGFLLKKSPKKMLGKVVWQKRWFELCENFLTIYKTPSDDLHTKQINMGDCTKVVMRQAKSSGIGFDIHFGEGERVFELKLDKKHSESDRLWPNLLNQCGEYYSKIYELNN
jgi:hypothetical protein